MPYVNMNDSFMSGWGGAARGRSILCIRCETWADARRIERAAEERSEMRRIAISENPRRGRPGDHISVKRACDLGGPWLRHFPPGTTPEAPADETAKAAT